jgi:hypothetical protein
MQSPFELIEERTSRPVAWRVYTGLDRWKPGLSQVRMGDPSDEARQGPPLLRSAAGIRRSAPRTGVCQPHQRSRIHTERP